MSANGKNIKAYYNEFDPKAAAWLRELIKEGHIAYGEVDERSITEVTPADLRGYTQCHFFAGIGGWSYALRLAGWPDDRPVWTGSCPCQPFSAAGKRRGTADDRHLWPQFFRLINECQPSVVFGEQVASKDGLAWLDAVYADLEGAGYAVGAADLCAAGVGAPHIRQRLYFVADGMEHDASDGRQQRRPESSGRRITSGCDESDAAHTESEQHDGRGNARQGRQGRRQLTDGSDVGHASGQGPQGRRERGDGRDELLTRTASMAGDVGDADGRNARAQREQRGGQYGFAPQNGQVDWSAAEFIPCTDGKARPVESGTFPLAHGVPGRVGLLRGYGNAIVPQVAAEFVGAFLDANT